MMGEEMDLQLAEQKLQLQPSRKDKQCQSLYISPRKETTNTGNKIIAYLRTSYPSSHKKDIYINLEKFTILLEKKE